jgi:hypothetical protein
MLTLRESMPPGTIFALLTTIGSRHLVAIDSGSVANVKLCGLRDAGKGQRG